MVLSEGQVSSFLPPVPESCPYEESRPEGPACSLGPCWASPGLTVTTPTEARPGHVHLLTQGLRAWASPAQPACPPGSQASPRTLARNPVPSFLPGLGLSHPSRRLGSRHRGCPLWALQSSPPPQVQGAVGLQRTDRLWNQGPRLEGAEPSRAAGEGQPQRLRAWHRAGPGGWAVPGARVHVSWPAGARRLSPLCASLSEQLWLHLSLCVTPTPTHPGGGGGQLGKPQGAGQA